MGHTPSVPKLAHSAAVVKGGGSLASLLPSPAQPVTKALACLGWLPSHAWKTLIYDFCTLSRSWCAPPQASGQRLFLAYQFVLTSESLINTIIC